MPNIENMDPASQEQGEKDKEASQRINQLIEEELEQVDAEAGGGATIDDISAMIDEEIAGMEQPGSEPLALEQEAQEAREKTAEALHGAVEKNAGNYIDLARTLDSELDPADFVKNAAEDAVAAFPHLDAEKFKTALEGKIGRLFAKAVEDAMAKELDQESMTKEQEAFVDRLEKGLENLKG